MADQLAKEVDFFSIGTNDLIQYTLAVDRTNETVADLYSAADPAVLRLIAMVVAAAQVRGLEVSVCGTMGGEPLYTMLLLGLGLRQLSMPPHQLPEVKRVIRGIRIEQARAVAAEALRQETAQAVVELLHEALRRALPETPVKSPDCRRRGARGDASGSARRPLRRRDHQPNCGFRFGAEASARNPNSKIGFDSLPVGPPPPCLGRGGATSRGKGGPATRVATQRMMTATKVRLRFAKRGDLRLVSHHDLLRCLERTLRRAQIPMAVSQGFNPRPKIVFALALALGIEGRREVVELELAEPLEPAELLERLTEVSPPGLDWVDVKAVAPGRSAPQVEAVQYFLEVPVDRQEATRSQLAALLASTQWPYTRHRRGP